MKPLRARLDRIGASPFARGVRQVASGTALGQLATLAIAPLLTRLFTPEEFGLLGLFTSFTAFLGVATALRYELAIASAKSDREATVLTRASIAITLLVAPLGALTFHLLVSRDWLGFGGFPSWGAYTVWAGLTAVGWASALRYHLVQRERFSVIARVPVVQNIVRAGVHVSTGLAGLGAVGLVCGEILGRGTTVVQMLAAGPSLRDRTSKGPRAKVRETAEVLRDYSTFPKYALASGLLDALGLYIALPLLATFYGEEEAGLFFLVQRVVTLPVGFVVVSVADVFHGRLSRMARESPEAMVPFFGRVARGLASAGLAFGVATVATAPWAFGWVFGAEWASAGMMAAVMAPWAVGQLVVGPISRAIFVVDAMRAKLVVDVVTLVVSVASVWSAHAMGMSVLAAVGLFSLAQAGVYVIYFALIRSVLVSWCGRAVAVTHADLQG